MILEVLKNVIANADNADQAIVNIQQIFGGSEIYIPSLSTEIRNNQIKREYNGHNLAELSKKFSISYSTVWRIINLR